MVMFASLASTTLHFALALGSRPATVTYANVWILEPLCRRRGTGCDVAPEDGRDGEHPSSRETERCCPHLLGMCSAFTHSRCCSQSPVPQAGVFGPGPGTEQAPLDGKPIVQGRANLQDYKYHATYAHGRAGITEATRPQPRGNLPRSPHITSPHSFGGKRADQSRYLTAPSMPGLQVATAHRKR